MIRHPMSPKFKWALPNSVMKIIVLIIGILVGVLVAYTTFVNL